MQAGNKLPGILIVAAYLLISSIASGDVTMKLKIPFQADTAQCYERLSQSNQEFRNGFDALKSIAEGPEAFSMRREKILKQHDEILRKGKALPPQQPWREENAYVCAVYDLIESFFSAEEENILKLSDAKEKQKHLKELMKDLDKIDFGSPQWNGRIKPRIESEIQDNLAKVR